MAGRPPPAPPPKPRSQRNHKCSVCLELFTEPKILPCCHTFCLECLKKTASRGKTEGQITCPKCRQSHPIPAGGLSEFLTDFLTKCEVEAAGLNVPTKRDDTQVCGECGQNDPISHFCTECQKYLCSVCGLDLHKRLKIYKGHNVCPIARIDAATLQSCRMPYCTLHTTEVLKLYCETCEKLVCRDCTLVDHREHSYKFVQDARKLVETEMASLKSDVEKKLYPLKRNLCEIIKVETAVAGYPEVLKADINSFFDNLVRSIEARRSTLLHEAEHVCQKDAKQVWADMEYHETMLAHISAVFGLVEKAMRCTSDSEMILTALQSIRQLRMIKEREWDGSGFTSVVSATPTFCEGESLALGDIGSVESVTNSTALTLVRNYRGVAYLSSVYTLKVSCSMQEEPLVDGRSGNTVTLQHTTSPALKVVVKYGQSKKELDNTYITVSRQPTACPMKRQVSRKATESESAIARPMKRQSLQKATESETVYRIKIRPVCGGEHTVSIIYGNSIVSHCFTVKGMPRQGARVRRGPDWGKERSVSLPDTNNGIVGTACPEMTLDRYGRVVTYVGQGDNDTLPVGNLDMSVSYYKWGRDGEYEVELA